MVLVFAEERSSSALLSVWNTKKVRRRCSHRGVQRGTLWPTPCLQGVVGYTAMRRGTGFRRNRFRLAVIFRERRVASGNITDSSIERLKMSRAERRMFGREDATKAFSCVQPAQRRKESRVEQHIRTSYFLHGKKLVGFDAASRRGRRSSSFLSYPWGACLPALL